MDNYQTDCVLIQPPVIISYPSDATTAQWDHARPSARPLGVTPVPLEEGKDVLVVDDEPYLLDLVSDVLEAEGHQIHKATNGAEALDVLREHKPQLILLDLMMPIMDGWELAAALRRNPEWQDIPIVIITADYHISRAQQETGARAVITKPFDIDRLTEVVRAYAA